MKLNHEDFFTGMREAWGSLSQKKVTALTALLDFIESDEEMSDVRWGAYALATIKHETAHTYEPIAEYGKGKGKPYGKADPITGQRYYGRGFVQLTWKKNYEKLGELLSVDLVDRPDLAMDPDTAYQILSIGMRDGLFTGKKLSHYIHDDTCDYLHARRIINGMDKAQLIAGYATQFKKILDGAAEDDQPELIKNGEVAEAAPKESTTETVKTTVVEEAAGVTKTEETSLVSKIISNDKVKEIASTGMSVIGTRAASTSVSAGAGATVWAFITGNWIALVVGAIFIAGGIYVWHTVYKQRQRIKELEALINSDKDRADVKFK